MGNMEKKSGIQWRFIVVAVVYAIVQFLIFVEYLFGFYIDRLDDIVLSIFMTAVLQHYTNHIAMGISCVVKNYRTKFIIDLMGTVFNVVNIPFFWFINMFLTVEGSNHYSLLNPLCMVYGSFVVVFVYKSVMDYKNYKLEKKTKNSDRNGEKRYN